MKEPRLQAKLSALRAEFCQAALWIDCIPLEKWTQAYDGGKRYGHMTINLAEYMNSILKGTRSLPIWALVRTTFQRTNSWFVEQGTKVASMIVGGHQFPKDLVASLRKNQQQSALCHVQRFNQDNTKFDVQEITSLHLRSRPMSFKVKLNEWWCDCGEFQAL